MKTLRRSLIPVLVFSLFPFFTGFWQAEQTSVPSTKLQAPPVAKRMTSIVNADEVRVNEGFDSVDIDVVGNDVLEDPEYALLIVSPPALGSVALNNNRGITYTLADSSFSGCLTFEYGINDNPEPTTANNDVANTLIDRSILISVLDNDTDPQNDDLQITNVSNPAHGSVQLTNGGTRIRYTPEPGYTGPDEFTYEITDGNGNTSTATVRIDVRLANDGTLHFIPPKWHEGPHAINPTEIWINTESPTGASGTIFLAGSNISRTFSLADNATTFRLELPTVSANFGLTYPGDLAAVRNQGLKVVSDNNPVNVQIVQEASNGQSFLTSKSLVALGTEFYACQMEDINLYEQGNQGISFISIMATANNTEVSFSNSRVSTWYKPFGTRPAGNHSIVLQENETYVVGINNTSQDITGTKITASKPIAVSSGTMGAGFSGGNFAVDNGWDQLVPIERAGVEFVIFKGTSNPDKATFIPVSDGTKISVDGVPQPQTYNAGDAFTVDNRSSVNPRYVTSNKPMLAFLSSGRDPGRGENGFALVAPLLIDGRGLYHFRTPNPGMNGGSTASVRVFFLTATSATTSVRLTNLNSNLPVNTSGWRPLTANPAFSYLEKDLSGSTDFEVSSDVFIQVMMFSASRSGGGLSYISSFDIKTLNANDDQISVPENTSLTFSPLNNDADGEGDVISISNVGSLQNNSGNIVNNRNGTLTYTPNPDFTGIDSLEYTITDGNFNFSTATIYITVTVLPTAEVSIYVAPVPDRPNIVANYVEGVPLSQIGMDISINPSSDVDGSESLGPIAIISGAPPEVTLSAGTYDGAGNWTVALSDLATLTATGTELEEYLLTLTVENIDDAGCDQNGDGQNDTAAQTFSYDFILNVGTACPTIGGLSAPTSICSGDLIGRVDVFGFANATLAENWERDFNIEFVYMNNNTGDPYAEGVSLGVATPSQGSASIENINLPDTAGTYYIYAILNPPSSDADCREAAFTSVQVNAPAPFLIQGDSILCVGGSNTLSAPSAAAWRWSTGATTQSIPATQEGAYSVTATDAFGCETDARIEVVSNPISASLAIDSPVCPYDSDGRLSVNLLSGGVGRIFYQINDDPPQEDPVFDNLPAGRYTVRVSDSSTCSYSETLDLTSIDQLSVELEPLNRAIRSDDSIRLTPRVNGNPTQIAWTPATGLSCTNCLTPVLRPKVPATYTLRLTSEYGCTQTDSLWIDVKLIRRVYVPNVFSPDSSEPGNRRLTVFGGPEIIQIDEMVVYDRWGQQVYQARNFAPADLSVSWDGTFKNSPSPAGVYVYFVRASFADGTADTFTGDVALIR